MRKSSIEDVDQADADRGAAAGVAALARLTRFEWRRSGTALGQLDRAGTPAVLATPESGVIRKIVCSRQELDDERISSWAHELNATGAQVRVASGWVPDLAISDYEAAVISADPADPGARPAQIEDPLVISMLVLIFDQAWNASVPLDAAVSAPAAAPPAHEPTRKAANGSRELVATERELLRLLAEGATDESAARHLGISLRTARRHMAVLMNHLAATSRFQAGAEAAKRGWLS